MRNELLSCQPTESQPIESLATPRNETGCQPAFNKREIHITPLNYGYNVKIDCHTFAIETKENLIKQLTAYINDPINTEKKWFDKNTL